MVSFVKWQTGVPVLVMRQTSRFSCRDGMNREEKQEKVAKSPVQLYEWEESGMLELCFCALESFKRGSSKTVFPFNTVTQLSCLLVNCFTHYLYLFIKFTCPFVMIIVGLYYVM